MYRMLGTYCSREVKIGSLKIGGNNPIALQSMTNTDTLDVRATVEQVKRLTKAGCSLVRITTPTIEHVRSLEKIKDTLYKESCFVPLVADVHFLPAVALYAAEIVEKVRINPGNYVDKSKGQTEYTKLEHEQAKNRTKERMEPLIQACKKNKTVLRLGVNQGSLSERMLTTYGHTPAALVASAMEFVDICEEQEFYDIVLSMKSSSVKRMITSVKMAVEEMKNRGNIYPIHLGVTEAGNGIEGRLTSAIGIGTLLKEGIGDTIRVSLTEEPEREIPVARSIVYWAQHFAQKEASFESIPAEELPIASAVALGDKLIKGEDVVDLEKAAMLENEKATLIDELYQAAEVRYYKAHFVACPSCGRTLYNIQDVFDKVKNRFSSYKGITIAVMGCIVNGPGEMEDADYGYIGSGNGLVNLYKKGCLVEKNIREEEALDALERLINQ